MWPELAGSKEDVTGLGAALGGYGRLSSLGLTGQESSVSEREWERPCGGWAEEGRSPAGQLLLWDRIRGPVGSTGGGGPDLSGHRE